MLDDEGIPSIDFKPENPEHWELKGFTGREWEQTGNKTGNTGNVLLSHHLPIPPFEPVTLAFSVPHPT